MDKVSNSEIDKKEKDRLVDLKMQEMKRKNEAWAKRYEEIEADKKNSDIVRNLASLKLNEQNKIVMPEKPRVHDRNENPQKSFSQDTKRKSDRALHHTPRQQTGHQSSDALGDAAQKSAPPPDPKFNFLDDPDRFRSARVEKPSESYSRRNKTRSAAENTSWNRSNDWGIFSRGLKKSDAKVTGVMAPGFSRHKPFAVRRFSQGEVVPTKRQMEINMTGMERVRYQAWLRERERVDAERLARQRTATGGWRREWDLDKNFEGNENDASGGGYRNRTYRFINDATANKSQSLPKIPHSDTSRPRSVLTNKSSDSRQMSAVPHSSGSHSTRADHATNERKPLALESNIPEVLITRQASPIEDPDNSFAPLHNKPSNVSVEIVESEAADVSNSQLRVSSTLIDLSEGNDGLDETVRSEQLMPGSERVKEDKVGDVQDDQEQWEDVEEGENDGQENENCEFRDAVEVIGRECQ